MSQIVVSIVLLRDEKILAVIHPVNHCFKKAVHYHTYCPAETSTRYDSSDSKHISKIVTSMTAQISPHTFNSFHQISIIVFLKNIKLACDTNGQHKDAFLWLFHFFMNKTESAELNPRLSAERTDVKYSRSVSHETKYFATYTQGNSLLAKELRDRWCHSGDRIQNHTLCVSVNHDVVPVC